MDANTSSQIGTLYQPNTIFGPNNLTLIIICSIIACLACIYAVFFFGRKLQDNAMLRSTLVEGMKQQEYSKLLEELRKKADEGALDSAGNPPPRKYNRFKSLWHPDLYTGNTMESEYFCDEASDEGKKRKEEWNKARIEKEKIENEWSDWENKEKAVFERMRKEAESKALEIAENKVPKSMDISLLGGGFSFLLEFSTVIVIIFTLLILGILGSLEGQQIATILASIAGYVLGKASSAQGKEASLGSTPSSQGTKPKAEV
jgi:hypothetical protein